MVTEPGFRPRRRLGRAWAGSGAAAPHRAGSAMPLVVLVVFAGIMMAVLLAGYERYRVKETRRRTEEARREQAAESARQRVAQDAAARAERREQHRERPHRDPYRPRQWEVISNGVRRRDPAVQAIAHAPEAPVAATPDAGWPGFEDASIATLAIDASGIYVGSTADAGRMRIDKLSHDGASRLWPEALIVDVDGLLSLAGSEASGDLLALTAGGRLMRFDRADGAPRGSWDVSWGETVPGGMAAGGATLVVAFPRTNAVRFLNPRTGAVMATIAVPAPAGVAVKPDGNVLVASPGPRDGPEAGRIYEIERNEGAIRERLTGLDHPTRIAIDRTTGEVYVYEAGDTRQITRYDSACRHLATFGRHGGRSGGSSNRQDFAGISDMAATGQGLLIVREGGEAGRTAIVDAVDGRVKQAWPRPL